MKHIFKKFIVKYWRQVFAAQMAYAITTLADSMIPIITKEMVVSSVTSAHMWLLATLIVGVLIWRLQYGGNMKTDRLRNDMIYYGRIELLEKLERCKHLPDKKELLNYVQHDTTEILSGQVELIICYVGFIIDLLIGCSVVWYFLSFSYMVILFVTCVVIISIILIFVVRSNSYNKKYHEVTVRFRKMLTGFGTLFQDYLFNNNTKFACEKIHGCEKEMYDAFVVKRHMKNNVQGLAFAMKSISTVLIVFIIKVITPVDQFSVTDTLTLIAFFHYIYIPLQMILNLTNQKSELDVVLKRVEEIMSREELSESDGQIDLKGPVQSIQFENVKYAISKDGSVFTILNGISLDVKQGQKIGLVGPSGTGKSTLVKALYRDIDITSGAVKINGRDVHDYTRESLYNAFFIVSQESRALEGTIKENLQVANPHATDEEMMNALIKAGLEGFNLNEVVEGDGARQLSGGERQRLAIARMFLRPEVRVIILDEATSALDESTQYDVLTAIKKFQSEGNRIIFSIAHRLSTVRNADMICVLSNGKVIEQGDHDFLMSLSGEYYKLNRAAENLWKD